MVIERVKYEMSRTYTCHKWKGKIEVLTWTQGRCLKCKRFLAKREIKFCGRCRPLMNKLQNKLSTKNYRVKRSQLLNNIKLGAGCLYASR